MSGVQGPLETRVGTTVPSVAALSMLDATPFQSGELAYVIARGLFLLSREDQSPIDGLSSLSVSPQGAQGRWLSLSSTIGPQLSSNLSIYNIEDYGAKAGTDSTQGVRNAVSALSANGGGILWAPFRSSPFFVSDEISLPSNTWVLALDEIRQTVATKAIFTATGQNNIRLTGRLAGVAGNVAAPTNYGVHFVNCQDVLLWGVLFQDILGVCAFLEGGTDLWMDSCRVKNSWEAVVGRGVNRLTISKNHIRDAATPVSTFVVPIHIDSTNNHTFGSCTNIEIDGNEITNYPAGQAISIDSGKHATIKGNICDNVLLGISLELSATVPADAISDVTIVGNTVNCTSTPGSPPAASNYGINAQGSGVGSRITDVTIGKNVVRNANQIGTAQNLLGAGYYLQDIVGVSVDGNVAEHCFGSSYMIGPDVLDVAGKGNISRNVQAGSGGTQAGVLFGQGSNGATGQLEVIVDGALHAVEFDAGGIGDSSPDLALTIDPFAITGSFYTSIDGGTVGFLGALRRPYIPNQTTPNVHGCDYIQPSPSAPTTWTNLLDPQSGSIGSCPGKTIEIMPGNNNLTLANGAGGVGEMRLKGGVNVTLTANQAIRLRYDGVLTVDFIEVSRNF